MQSQNQPQYQYAQIDNNDQKEDFKNPLCGCTKNCCFCLASVVCPIYLLYKNAQAIDKATQGKRSCYMACCLDLLGCGCFNRESLRDAYNIKGSLCSDCVVMYLCSFCAMAQHHYEAEERSS